MTKEMKLSLTILAVLASLLGGVLTWRVFWPGEQIVATGEASGGRPRPKPVDLSDDAPAIPPRTAPHGRWGDSTDPALELTNSTDDEPSKDESSDNAPPADAAALMPAFGRPFGNEVGTGEPEVADDSWAADRQTRRDAAAREATWTTQADGDEPTDEDEPAADAEQSASPPRAKAAAAPRSTSRWQPDDDPESALADSLADRFAAADDDATAPGELPTSVEAEPIDADWPDPATDEPAAVHDAAATNESSIVTPTRIGDDQAQAGASRPLRSVLVAPGSRATQLSDTRVVPATHAEPLDAATYTVGEGESLFDVARSRLGSAARWVEIYELNRRTLGREIDLISPGTRLVLPDSTARF